MPQRLRSQPIEPRLGRLRPSGKCRRAERSQLGSRLRQALSRTRPPKQRSKNSLGGFLLDIDQIARADCLPDVFLGRAKNPLREPLHHPQVKPLPDHRHGRSDLVVKDVP